MQLTTPLFAFFLASTTLASPLLLNKRNPKTFYTIDGEEILHPGPTPYLDPNSRIVYPVDWPRYNTWEDQYCQPHSKDAPRLQVGAWWEQCNSSESIPECPAKKKHACIQARERERSRDYRTLQPHRSLSFSPSLPSDHRRNTQLTTSPPTEIVQWQIDQNTFVSRAVADQARLDEERRRRDAERERQDDRQRREHTLASCRQTPNTLHCRGVLSLDAAGKKQKQKEKQVEKEQQGGDGV